MVRDILKELKEKLELQYIAVFTQDGFLVYDEGERFDGIEEFIGEASKIYGEMMSVFLKDFGEITNSFSVEFSSKRKVLFYRLNEEYCIIAFLKEGAILGKARFFISNIRSRVLNGL